MNNENNFFSQKSSNIRKTWFLFSGFLIVVIGLGYFLSSYFGRTDILLIAVIFSSIMSITSYWFSDKIVLQMSGAQLADKKAHQEIFQIVENLSSKAKLPVPKIYIINDPSPNAFATGRNPKNASLAVTTGLLERLDRSELEGVISHELSHIGNWDMLLSTAVVILAGFVSIISNFFLRSLFWGGRSNDNDRSKNNPLMFFLMILFAILAPLGAMIIQLAISRKREFLADASGALLTNQPKNLASALKKISHAPAVRGAQNTTAHLWFENPFGQRPKTLWFQKLFMTHPPVEERIAALLRK